MKEGKTNTDLVLDVLRSGQKLKLSEITAYIGEISGKTVKQTDISSLLSRLCNKDKSEIGYLIKRNKKKDGRYAYTLVKDALDMTPEETYDLARKIGKNRFTLEKAITKYPGLKKHVRKSRTPKAGATAEPDETKSTLAENPAHAANPENQNEIRTGEVDMMQIVRQLIDTGLNIKVNVNINFITG